MKKKIIIIILVALLLLGEQHNNVFSRYYHLLIAIYNKHRKSRFLHLLQAKEWTKYGFEYLGHHWNIFHCFKD